MINGRLNLYVSTCLIGQREQAQMSRLLVNNKQNIFSHTKLLYDFRKLVILNMKLYEPLLWYFYGYIPLFKLLWEQYKVE